jgi:CRP-like cAMP-binding protein
MCHIIQRNIKNRLLSLLPKEDFELLEGDLERVEMPRLFVLSQPNEPTSFCYFIDAGIGSIVASSPAGKRAEIGIFGREGMSPTALALEARSDPYSIFMQVGGYGHRVATAVLLDFLSRSVTFRTLLNRYTQTISIQTAYTGLSNALHHIDERLARWILMCHDRTEGDRIELTHEFLAMMLGVRRPSVTTALHVLEGHQLITSERGLITIRNRCALEIFARDAYGPPEQEYRRLIGRI